MTQEQIPLQPNEEITPIQGYEGLYSITSFGRVWSHKRKVFCNKGYRVLRGVFLKYRLNKSNYITLSLNNNNIKRNYLIHRLVAQYYIPNPNNLPEVNHKDGDKQNNFAGTRENNYSDGNLEWCTDQDNHNHAMLNGLKYKIYSYYHGVSLDKQLCRISKPWKAQIMLKRKNYFLGYFKTEIEAAKAYNKFVLDNKLNRPLNKIEENV